ncbi:MAG TPA: peroxiredoxin [Phenylobacterium sp.]|uniref:peroxiredoxin family protein n=1 Tax=Phenylobacterium sp. TaxID=1871053 RepID=UPI002B49FD62|nr:peroxiredoxin [Phenylobacterium sp.]HKR87199.1 peroxiredoxin [Phenylobacterium sp.]
MSETVAMSGQVARGDRLPDASLAFIEGGELAIRKTSQLFARGRFVIVGAPGAFTPVCTQLHLPGFVDSAPSLLASGFDGLVCIAPNDPWTLAAWSRRIDPEGRLRFLSDGNLEFGRSAGLLARAPELFMGVCLQRFLLIAQNGMVERIHVEPEINDVSCTAPHVI